MSPAEENSRILVAFVNGQAVHATIWSTNNMSGESVQYGYYSWVSDNSSSAPPWIPQRTDDEIIEEYVQANFKK